MIRKMCSSKKDKIPQRTVTSHICWPWSNFAASKKNGLGLKFFGKHVTFFAKNFKPGKDHTSPDGRASDFSQVEESCKLKFLNSVIILAGFIHCYLALPIAPAFDSRME